MIAACGADRSLSDMPELPEAERARQQIERALGREIVAVDDTRHLRLPPARAGRDRRRADRATGSPKALRRGKFLWAETDGGPELGLHLGMAGRIVDRRPSRTRTAGTASRCEFADGGRLALRDKRRLGRAVIEPDFTHIGPDAADVSRDAFRERVGRGLDGAQGPAARPEVDRRRRQPARRRDALAGAALNPRALSRRAERRRSSTTSGACCAPPPAPRSARAACTPATSSRYRKRGRAVPALRDDGRAGDDRRPHDLLVSRLPAMIEMAKQPLSGLDERPR